MSEEILYLNGVLKDDCVIVSPESFLVLFSLQCCRDATVNIVFVNSSNSDEKISGSSLDIFPILLQDLIFKYTFQSFEQCPEMIQNCCLPAVHIPEKLLCVVGLSASLRQVLSTSSTNGNNICERLLGFRRGCLQACAEVSVWTKFCEIEIVEMLHEMFSNDCSKETVYFPRNFLRFENHLKHPPILHNALKRKQTIFKERVSDKDEYSKLMKTALKDLPNLEHTYAEGIDFTLADVLLYASFSLVLKRLSNVAIKCVCPLVLKWFLVIGEEECIKNSKVILAESLNKFPILNESLASSLKIPTVPDESLYKSDPDRYKPRWRSYTNQNQIEDVLGKVENDIEISDVTKKIYEHLITDELKYTSTELLPNLESLSINNESNFDSKNIFSLSTFTYSAKLNWNSFESGVSPYDGKLPASRLERKHQQLENMALAVLAIAKKDDKIVDFCAGGGHLGILLAYLLPWTTVMLVENKDSSLELARIRVLKLGLKNVEFYRCNLDYFNAKFDIGVCLHACGVATDLVMKKCYDSKASFVCCPCCYGSIQPNHILTYPRSSLYSTELSLSVPEYMILAHSSDQTHDKDNPKTDQGKMCMVYIDCDRLMLAKELGYDITLSIMDPPSCSPKNHLLIGRLKS